MENWEILKIATLEILAFSDINNMPRSQNFPGVLPLSPNQESALDRPVATTSPETNPRTTIQ